jgi:hypothetical protein
LTIPGPPDLTESCSAADGTARYIADSVSVGINHALSGPSWCRRAGLRKSAHHGYDPQHNGKKYHSISVVAHFHLSPCCDFNITHYFIACAVPNRIARVEDLSKFIALFGLDRKAALPTRVALAAGNAVSAFPACRSM